VGFRLFKAAWKYREAVRLWFRGHAVMDAAPPVVAYGEDDAGHYAGHHAVVGVVGGCVVGRRIAKKHAEGQAAQHQAARPQ
jgi:hypothetical protein